MAQKRKQKKKWLWWGVGAVLLVVIGVGGFLIFKNNAGEKTDETETSETEEQKITEPEQAETGELSEGVTEKAKVVQYEGEDPNEAEDLSGVVTYAAVSGSNLVIRVSIDQYLSEGSCELTLRRGGVTIYNSIASIVGNASTSTCEGFDVPTGELGGGNVEIVINLSAGGRNGVISGEASI